VYSLPDLTMPRIVEPSTHLLGGDHQVSTAWCFYHKQIPSAIGGGWTAIPRFDVRLHRVTSCSIGVPGERTPPGTHGGGLRGCVDVERRRPAVFIAGQEPPRHGDPQVDGVLADDTSFVCPSSGTLVSPPPPRCLCHKPGKVELGRVGRFQRKMGYAMIA
jgi:hypothetical protein